MGVLSEIRRVKVNLKYTVIADKDSHTSHCLTAYFLLLQVARYTVKSDIFICAFGKVRCSALYVLHDVTSQPLDMTLLL